MATITQQAYTPKTFDLSGLQGISDNTLTVHFGLYEGYVKNVNLLSEELAELLKNGQASGTNPHYAELTRRLGFEYNGMVLHEYYFGNLTKTAGTPPAASLEAALGGVHGDFESWKKDFSAIGGMRGVGWAVAYYDPQARRISNHWITLHEVGNVAGFVPLLVMDLWEHAWLLDYKPTEHATKYVEAFFANVDWNAVQARFEAAALRHSSG